MARRFGEILECVRELWEGKERQLTYLDDQSSSHCVGMKLAHRQRVKQKQMQGMREALRNAWLLS